MNKDSKNQAQKTTSFKLTEQSFKKLENESVPENILNALRPLENCGIYGEESFLNAIKEHIEEEHSLKYGALILKYAQNNSSNESKTGGNVISNVKTLVRGIGFVILFLFFAHNFLGIDIIKLYERQLAPYKVWIEQVNRQSSPPTIELTIYSKQKGTAQVTVSFMEDNTGGYAAIAKKNFELDQKETKKVTLPIELTLGRQTVAYKYVRIDINGEEIHWRNR